MANGNMEAFPLKILMNAFNLLTKEKKVLIFMPFRPLKHFLKYVFSQKYLFHSLKIMGLKRQGYLTDYCPE